MQLTEALLTGTAWRFGELTSGTVYTDRLRLRPGGAIENYLHPNEIAWKLEAATLAFFGADGAITSYFSLDPLSDPPRLIGRFQRGDGAICHFLEAISPARIIYPLHLIWQEKFELFFAAQQIMLAFPDRIAGVHAANSRVILPRPIMVERYAKLSGGNFYSCGCHSYSIGDGITTGAAEIGRYCSLAKGIEIIGHGHPVGRISTHPFTYAPDYEVLAQTQFGIDYKTQPYGARVPAPVIIGNDVWIGADALLKGGITIGDGAVVAARAVVTHDIPPYAIVAGIPAKVIRMRFDAATIEKLLHLRWWRYNFIDLPRCWTEIDRFIDATAQAAADGSLQPYTPDIVDIGASLLSLMLE